MIQRETSASEQRRPGSPIAAVGPVRTCVGCRDRQLAAELLRVAAVATDEGEFTLAVDTAGTLPGRGAWLHPNTQCLRSAVRRRAFGRALRISGSPDTTAVAEHIAAFEARNRTGSKNMSTP